MSPEQKAIKYFKNACTPSKVIKEFVLNNRPAITACMKKWIPDLRPNDTDRITWLRKAKPSSKCWKNVACNQICLKYKEAYDI